MKTKESKTVAEVKRGRGRPTRIFSAVQRRSIKLCKAKGLTAKQTADKINKLKVTLKEKPVSVYQMVRAFDECSNW